MQLRIFDIGGSGVKTALIKKISHKVENFPVTHYHNPNWQNFTYWLHQNGLIDSDLIGISCAGFIEVSGIVKMFRVGKWTNKNLPYEIKKHRQQAKVYILNDAEAHLMAHYDLYKQPQISISLGTSIGFAISDSTGNIIRPPDKMNFDIGGLKIPTTAANNFVWWALGSDGLTELQKEFSEKEGARRYGFRLGSFLAGLCSLFRPSTVVLSGGITEKWWDNFHQAMLSEFTHNRLDWLKEAQIVKSPFASNAAIIGISKYVLLNQDNNQ